MNLFPITNLHVHLPPCLTVNLGPEAKDLLNDILTNTLTTLLATLIKPLDMKLSEVKTAVAEIKKNNAEGLAEIGNRIGALQKQIDDLVAGNADPDVTDEQFTADLAEAQVSAKALADIVPAEVHPQG